MRDDSIDDLDRRAGDSEPSEVERHGVQSARAREDQVSCGQIPRRIALRHCVLLSRLQRAHDDLRVVERLQVGGLHRVKDRLAARQEMRPAMCSLVGACVDDGQRFGFAAAIGNTEQARTGRGRERNHSVVGPGSAAVALCAHVARQRCDRDHGTAGDRYLPQRLADEEAEPATIRREEGRRSTFGACDRPALRIVQLTDAQRPTADGSIHDARSRRARLRTRAAEPQSRADLREESTRERAEAMQSAASARTARRQR